MRSENESSSLLGSYTGLDGRILVTFVALVAGVLIVVTGIYVAIFGFQNWKRDMRQAGSMMVAGFNTPAANVGGVTPSPVQATPGVSSQMNAPAQNAAQFVCPNCGTVGLPNWSPNGTPTCPNCGSVMGVVGRTGTNLHLAARP